VSDYSRQLKIERHSWLAARIVLMARILMSGASGLIGSALVPYLRTRGHEVVCLVRREPDSAAEVRWEPMREISPQLVSGFDAVIHLSGETVAGFWNAEKKKHIRDSRVISTRNLVQAMTQAEKPPSSFICASAIGYYGSRGDETLTEESTAGGGFLASVTKEWEDSTSPAEQSGIRTANLRIGIVLSKSGGALKQMLLPFRLGLGGRIGSGEQWWSWIQLADMVSAVGHTLQHKLNGPVNMTAPAPVTNAEFTAALARVLHRPALLPVPAWALRIALHEFADDGPLASARVLPKKLQESGFSFAFPGLLSALQELSG
jgi:uncharacterized protein (TIGR01777 family)